MRNAVIGQTGKVLLSVDAINRKLGKRRTIRYQYKKWSDKMWMAWVCGPFHFRTFGVCGFGTSKSRSKAALRRRLANDYGYIGHLMFSDVDESDTVGIVDTRLLDDKAVACPITFAGI